jgi:hypothetical protein
MSQNAQIEEIIRRMWECDIMEEQLEEQFGGDEGRAIEEYFIPNILLSCELEIHSRLYRAIVLGIDEDDDFDNDLMNEFFEAFDEFVENEGVYGIMRMLGFELPMMK